MSIIRLFAFWSTEPECVLRIAKYSLAHTLLLNAFSALKGIIFYILFVVTVAGVALCGSPKKQPRTSSIVKFIVFF